MPVKAAAPGDVDTSFWNHLNINVDDLYATTSESLLSEDIWNKFGFLSDLAFEFDDEFGDSDTQSDDLIAALNCEIRNHDCMWAGHCHSKHHPNLETLKPQKATVEAPTELRLPKQTVVPAGRSVLLKPPVTKAMVASPESPPMSDDEEAKAKPTKTLQFLHDAISECDVDEDSDLCEYFEDGEGEDIITDPADEEEKPKMPPRFAGENDHCYYMERGTYGRVDSLGIDTPSDSEEEEIDVVSINDKLTTRITYALPTNPSTRDRHQLQKTVATAISNKRFSATRIKTILPLRKSEPSPAKRRQESRGVKRGATPGTSPNKRRANCASDSEPEPSEKRNMHNNMERQRRIDLRNAFEDLRMLVPEVSSKEKAAKVAILREAAQYCYQLGNISTSMARQKQELKRQQERLRSRVSQLRRSLAAKR